VLWYGVSIETANFVLSRADESTWPSATNELKEFAANIHFINKYVTVRDRILGHFHSQEDKARTQAEKTSIGNERTTILNRVEPEYHAYVGYFDQVRREWNANTGITPGRTAHIRMLLDNVKRALNEHWDMYVLPGRLPFLLFMSFFLLLS